jgi:hypothetical protein
VIMHPSVAGAAMLAGLLVAGGSYAARHDVGLGSALPASADARVRLEHELSVGYVRHRHAHLLVWHAPHLPKIRVRPPAPQVTVVTAVPVAAPVAAAAPAATTSAPVTRTSPVGGDDGGNDD